MVFHFIEREIEGKYLVQNLTGNSEARSRRIQACLCPVSPDTACGLSFTVYCVLGTLG